MTTQEAILRACNHSAADCEIKIRREILHVCCDCWNRGVRVSQDERKQQLAAHWQRYAAEQGAAMKAAGVEVGQRVSYFCASMLGFGGITVTGTIKLNRNGVPVVKLDHKYQGHSSVEWSRGWRPVQHNAVLLFDRGDNHQ